MNRLTFPADIENVPLRKLEVRLDRGPNQPQVGVSLPNRHLLAAMCWFRSRPEQKRWEVVRTAYGRLLELEENFDKLWADEEGRQLITRDLLLLVPIYFTCGKQMRDVFRDCWLPILGEGLTDEELSVIGIDRADVHELDPRQLD